MLSIIHCRHSEPPFHRTLAVQAAEIFEPRLEQAREKSVFGAMADKDREIVWHGKTRSA
ncbi:hypothetical protein [Bradyrhizobium elkanii]|uniref:hypothetical protein n=1 Tax=Bradyrhizobium elkanii TaxID=29448 RepID=UPI001FD99F3E|nr:hypothetical protein [Bradyrhizobium elkanii]